MCLWIFHPSTLLDPTRYFFRSSRKNIIQAHVTIIYYSKRASAVIIILSRSSACVCKRNVSITRFPPPPLGNNAYWTIVLYYYASRVCYTSIKLYIYERRLGMIQPDFHYKVHSVPAVLPVYVHPSRIRVNVHHFLFKIKIYNLYHPTII